MHIFVVCVYVSLVVTTAEIIGPRNIAVIRGSAATFDCVINAPETDVCWTYQSVSFKSVIHLYAEGELTPNCNDSKCTIIFHNETKSNTLTINSVQHYDAGFYSCRICQEADEHTAQLVVLQTGE